MAIFVLALGGVQSAPRGPQAGVDALAQLDGERTEAYRALARMEHGRTRLPHERRLFDDAARTAWAYMDGRFHPATSLVPPVQSYGVATVWDIGSILAAVHAAHGLGLIDDGAYRARMTAILRTLQRLPLYDGRMFGRAYDTRTGTLIRGRGPRIAGWSAIDLGRLLIWLRIVAADPAFTRAAEAVVRRIDLQSAVKSGYLWGEDVDAVFNMPFAYQEGRIGYEQYAAQGFRLWGLRAEKALSLTENAVPISILGQTLPADRRRWDRLTTEPFLLIGLETGWDRHLAHLVRRLVAAQEARYQRTGRMTLAGEDAIDEPPHYFYYYCVFANGKQFGVDVQDRGRTVDGPRWVSAKSAFALHALMPGRYSAQVVAGVLRAREPGGWASGVLESTGRSTGTPNINTAAVILEAALVYRSGEPVLDRARRMSRRVPPES